MSRARELVERRRRVVARGVGQFAGDVTAASASGARITDADGRELIDLASGIGVTTAGHCPPSVVAAIQDQAERLLHACIHVATYEPYLELCERLVELAHPGVESRAVLVNSGAEAVENAIKIARQATGRPAVVCFTEAFHGRTLLASTLTSKVAYKSGCGPFASDVYRLPFPNRFRRGDGLSEQAFVEREIQRFEAAFVNTVAPEQIAAVLIEPIQGEGGFVPAPAQYLRKLREITAREGIVLIADEVQSGLGRCGRWASYQYAGIEPDLVTWAKTIASGLPLAAVTGRAEVMDKALPGTLGGTYGGNPVACAAGIATLKLLQEMDAPARAEAIGRRVRQRFERIAEHTPLVCDVRGLGAMLAMELCYEGDPWRPAADVVSRIVEGCLDRGVIVLPCSPWGNVLRVLCPLAISDSDLERALDVLEGVVHEATGAAPAA
jgi:4-aminobutyrate aminotransferase/(S)-3-amino-2-methylpropionate transaminase